MSYSVADAWQNLQSGNVARGREMLKTLSEERRPSIPDAHTLLGFECLRSPVEIPTAEKCLERLDEAGFSYDCAAKSLRALWAPTLKGLADIEAVQRGYGHLLEALQLPVLNGHVAALLVSAVLTLHDANIQMKVRDTIGRPVPQPVVLGMGIFMQRRGHEEALSVFSDPMAFLACFERYEEHFGQRLSEKDHNVISREVARGCLAGKALTLRDMGRMEEARNAWKELDSQTATPLVMKMALRQLAAE